MSPRKVEARFVPSDATGDVRSVEVFGLTLTESFADIEVSDEVLGKLAANPHVEVKGKGVVNFTASADSAFDHDGDGKPGGSKPRRGKPAKAEA